MIHAHTICLWCRLLYFGGRSFLIFYVCSHSWCLVALSSIMSFGVSRLGVFYNLYVFPWIDGLLDRFYCFCLLVVWSYFMLIRVPYVYDAGECFILIGFLVFPLFLSLMFARLFGDIRCLLASFVPVGTPYWIAPFVCLAETQSYLVRPFVLILRPFVNLTVGAFFGYSLGLLSFKVGYSYVFFLCLLILFMYEVFVALVHWFIVCRILSFSIDH